MTKISNHANRKKVEKKTTKEVKNNYKKKLNHKYYLFENFKSFNKNSFFNISFFILFFSLIFFILL